MLSNRRSLMGGPAAGPMSVDKSNPSRATWCRRASSFTVAPGSAYADGAAPPPLYSSSSSAAAQPDAQPHCQPPAVLTSTTGEIAGHRVVRAVGAVHGTATAALPREGVRPWLRAARGMGAEVGGLTAIIYGARAAAVDRMAVDCVSRGANAIVGLSFTEAEIAGCAAVSVQGTAVHVEVAGRKAVEDPFEEG